MLAGVEGFEPSDNGVRVRSGSFHEFYYITATLDMSRVFIINLSYFFVFLGTILGL